MSKLSPGDKTKNKIPDLTLDVTKVSIQGSGDIKYVCFLHLNRDKMSVGAIVVDDVNLIIHKISYDITAKYLKGDAIVRINMSLDERTSEKIGVEEILNLSPEEVQTIEAKFTSFLND